jgi:glucose-1-phosphate thymidylyltransferase
MKAVVLAGGSGSGLQVMTGGRPKVLIKILGKPFLERVLLNLREAGVDKAVIVSDKPSAFEDITYRLGRQLEFEIRNQAGREVIGAILTAADALAEGALLVYGDTLIPSEAYLLTFSHSVDSGDPTILIVPNEDVRLYGAVLIDESGNVISFQEKPRRTIEGAYAFGGVAMLNQRLVDLLAEAESLEEAINRYISEGGRVRTVLWSGIWVDLGYPVNVLEAMYYIMKGLKGSFIESDAEVSPKAVIEGPVYVDRGSIIDHYAIIRGPAYIGRGTMIGSHTFIRPYTDIEDQVTVSSYDELVWSIISENATIGRASFLGYSIVGVGATIEPGVITKLLTTPGEEGIKAIKVMKGRKLYFKAGAVIAAKSRVPSQTVLEPGVVYE